MIREPLSKKLKFEVLKRDKFTCQYCGKQSPEFRMEIDHIKPVCEGGKTHLTNLITACFDCNRGKGKILLSEITLKETTTIKSNSVKLIPASSSFDDILESWISYYEYRIPSQYGQRKECFLILLDTLDRHGYKKDGLTTENKIKIVTLCVNPHLANKVKLKKWILYVVKDLKWAFLQYYGTLIVESEQIDLTSPNTSC